MSLKAVFLLLTSLTLVNSSTDYQVIAYFKNAPAGAEAAALSATQFLFDMVSRFFLNCEFLEPGENYVGRRDLAAEGSEGDGSAPSLLRGGGSRHLQMSCPNACSSSGSTRCRSMGCAFCGRCRRQRELPTSISVSTASASSFGNGTTTSTSSSSTFTAIGSTAARTIESLFNSQLKKHCAGASNCEIWAKIHRVLSNGTTYPLTG
jgi:hypothetical protein